MKNDLLWLEKERFTSAIICISPTKTRHGMKDRNKED